MWHADWHEMENPCLKGRHFIAYLDDASRCITGFGVFDRATADNTIAVLRKAIAEFGTPGQVLSDHGVQFTSNHQVRAGKKRRPTMFERELERRGIDHILARVNHPQTNGKLERFHGELQRKLKWFDGVDSMVKWYNYDRPHDSLDQATLETPARAFARKMPEPGQTVTDKDSGRCTMPRRKRNNFGIAQCDRFFVNVISKGPDTVPLGARAARPGALAAAAVLALIAPSAYAAEPPPAQLRAGVAPQDVACNEGLVLVMRAVGPACVREQTAARLGLDVVERPARATAGDAPAFSDAAAHEAQVAEIRPHILGPVSEEKPSEPERIPVPPPERRAPVESLALFNGEPRRVTIMMDPDRTGYWPPLTKDETDEVVGRFADILGEDMDYSSVQKILGEDSGFVEVNDDFDYLKDIYKFYYFTYDALFTAGNLINDHGIRHDPIAVGGINYVRYFSPLSSVDHMEFITRFMDEMGFDGWSVYDPYERGTQVGRDRHEYYLFRGTHSDELDTSVLDRFDEEGPYTGDLDAFLQEVASGRIGVDDVRANYAQYEDRIREKIKSDWLPKKTEYSGFGRIMFGFDGGTVVIKFSGWSSDPIPDPVITRKEAVERAVEFARTDETLSGPRCGLDIPDRAVEDRPRHIRLTQFGGMPFWKVLMGPCETRHTIDELLENDDFDQFLGDYSLDVIDGHKTILLDENGDIDLASIGFRSLDKFEQNTINDLHKIDVAVYVDAIDGANTWFAEANSSYYDKLIDQTHSEDENVWFLEDGQAVFAEDWPKGYEDETFPLLLRRAS